MALYDYPHTGNYDQDLGFLIKQYKDLIDSYKGLIDIYARFLEEIEKNIHELFASGKLTLDGIYNNEDTSLSFVFTNNLTDPPTTKIL
jgi:DUF917 family protein|nr:MAG TPA: amantadine-binding protein [Caudoviricetes sp.]